MKVQVTSTDFRYARICLSPLGLHGWADRYWQVYEGLANDRRESVEAYLLLCRAIEIEFKAWHRHAGRTDRLNDRFRHNLIASYRALPKKHRILSGEQMSALQKASLFYLRQGFEEAESQRSAVKCPHDIDIGVLETAARKVMEHGDRRNLKLW